MSPGASRAPVPLWKLFHGCSVSSVSPVLSHSDIVPCHWGLCFGVCSAGKEKMELQEPQAPFHSQLGQCLLLPGAPEPRISQQSSSLCRINGLWQMLGGRSWRLGCCTQNQVFCDKIREIQVIEMLDETGSKRFHPIRSQDHSLAGWFGLGFFFSNAGQGGM